MGMAGNDLLHGGAGNDTEDGGAGNDVIYADSGNDIEYGGIGNDQLFGGTGVNFLHGGDGNDIMVSIGGSHIDRQWGGEGGNDSFWLDAESTECVMDATPAQLKTNVHRVAAYDDLHVNGVDKGAPARGMNVGNLRGGRPPPSPGRWDPPCLRVQELLPATRSSATAQLAPTT